MANYIYNEDIQKMTYNQLAKALVSGELSEKRLRSYYTDARRKATDRNRRVQASEFGQIAEPQRFMTLKNLPTQSALLHEIRESSVRNAEWLSPVIIVSDFRREIK